MRDLTEKIETRRTPFDELTIEETERRNRKAQGINLGYSMTFEYEPSDEVPIISINGTRCCSVGNMMAIVAPSGTGKSQLSEVVASSYLNPECDCFGIAISTSKSIILIDTERTKNDNHKGLMRIAKRVELDNNPELLEDGMFKNFHFKCFITIATVEERKTAIEELIIKHDPGLLIIDGLTDFIKSVNDEAESSEFITWLLSLANEHELAIMATIHPNPKEDTRKPRGHIGSEVNRKCESMLLLTRAKENKDIRILTTDFAYGKNRNGIDIIETSFSWNIDKGMFTSCFYTPKVENSINYGTRFNGLLENKSLSHSELVDKYRSLYLVSPRTAKRHIKEAFDLGILDTKDKKYQVKPEKHYDDYDYDPEIPF